MNGFGEKSLKKIKKFMVNCSQHKKELAGISDMKLLAEMIGDLHYESLAQLLKHLSQKFKQDSRKDWGNKKIQLANRLKGASIDTQKAFIQIMEAWQISKPFMEDKEEIKSLVNG